MKNRKQELLKENSKKIDLREWDWKSGREEGRRLAEAAYRKDLADGCGFKSDIQMPTRDTLFDEGLEYGFRDSYEEFRLYGLEGFYGSCNDDDDDDYDDYYYYDDGDDSNDEF